MFKALFKSATDGFMPWLLLAMFIVGMTVGSVINGWRLKTELESVKKDRAEYKLDQATKALDDLVSASKVVKDQAVANRTDVSRLNDSILKLRKEFENERPKPLPVDCLPDPVRVHKLDKTIDTVNETVTGRKSSSPVPSDTKTETQ